MQFYPNTDSLRREHPPAAPSNIRITKRSDIQFKKQQNKTPAAQVGVSLLDGPVNTVFIYGELGEKTNARSRKQ